MESSDLLSKFPDLVQTSESADSIDYLHDSLKYDKLTTRGGTNPFQSLVSRSTR